MQIKTVSPECSPPPPPRSPIMGGPGVRVEQPGRRQYRRERQHPDFSGNNVQIPVQVPVDICGNAVGLLGFANASCQGGAAAFLDSFNG